MNKTAKALLIPVAAFAVTVTGAGAFNNEVLEKAGLKDEQISAFEEAYELRKEGNKEAARDVLVDAGIDWKTMQQIRKAKSEYHQDRRDVIHDAIEQNDYELFKVVIEGSPIVDIVTSETDFEKFVEAYELREAGEREEARSIIEELGFEKPGYGKKGNAKGLHPEKKFGQNMRGDDSE